MEKAEIWSQSSLIPPCCLIVYDCSLGLVMSTVSKFKCISSTLGSLTEHSGLPSKHTLDTLTNHRHFFLPNRFFKSIRAVKKKKIRKWLVLTEKMLCFAMGWSRKKSSRKYLGWLPGCPPITVVVNRHQVVSSFPQIGANLWGVEGKLRINLRRSGVKIG